MDFEQHYLRDLFEPKSIAVIGASDKPGSIGHSVLRNLIDTGYPGKLYLVNPHHAQVSGIDTYPSVEQIPQRLDLAIVCTRAESTPEIVDACGRAGAEHVMVVSDGFGELGERGAALEREIRDKAREHRIRLMGPRCMGFARPALSINATFSNLKVLPGTVGIISQSNSLLSAALDWSHANQVGISLAVSLGDEADIGFDEVLDYMVADPRTQNIFLYIETVKDARRFMSALRAAARCKPVLLAKIGRQTQRVRAKGPQLHQIGADDVFDAALRRAGVVRVPTIAQMFYASRALFSRFRPRGNRLAIITNGGGPGVMAGDRALELKIPLVSLSEATREALAPHMPAHWVGGNPIDILSDADPERYAAAVRACLADDGIDGLIVILTPQARSEPTAIAQAVLEALGSNQKPLVACWLGGTHVSEGMRLLKAAGVPSFDTPGPAVELFSHISNYFRAQQLLVQSPGSLSDLPAPRVESARLVIETALMEGRKVLSAMEAKAVLAAFQIPIAQTVVARSATEAMVLAEELGLPVVLKVSSPDITRKSDCGGIRLRLNSLAEVRDAYASINEEVKRRCPEAHIEGIAIEPMVIKPNGREIMVGMTRDKIFGPAIVFGPGGSSPDADHAERVVALPPLNGFLVNDMLRSSSAKVRLDAYGTSPAADLDALRMILLRVSEMVCELPWITDLSINPLIIDESGAVAVDAQICIDNVSLTARRYDHVAVHPYPMHLQSHYQTPDGITITLRPIHPGDAEMEQVFVQRLSPETRYYRFMNTIRELSPAQLTRLTQIDYDREMAFVAVVEKEEPPLEVGVARYVTNPDGESCEFAIVVADAWAGKGLARRLMGTIIEAARDNGLKYMNGEFLAENTRMIRFVQSLGFVITPHPEDTGLKRGVLQLSD
jgi:acetyltransferase